jgi:4-oxalocrotonate tautomerase
MASPSTGSNTSPTNSTEDADAMPHVIVKLWPGNSEQQKRRLAQAITDNVMKVLRYGEESVSVAFEEVDANEWGREGVRGPTSSATRTPSTRNPDTRCDGGGSLIEGKV